MQRNDTTISQGEENTKKCVYYKPSYGNHHTCLNISMVQVQFPQLLLMELVCKKKKSYMKKEQQKKIISF